MGRGCYERYYEGAQRPCSSVTTRTWPLALRLGGQQRTHCPIHSNCFPFFHLLVLLTTLTSPLSPSPALSLRLFRKSGLVFLLATQRSHPRHAHAHASRTLGSSTAAPPQQATTSDVSISLGAGPSLPLQNWPLQTDPWNLIPLRRCARAPAATHRPSGRCLVTSTPFHRAKIRLPARVWPALYLASGFERCFSFSPRRRDLLPATANLRPHHHHLPRPPRLPSITAIYSLRLRPGTLFTHVHARVDCTWIFRLTHRVPWPKTALRLRTADKDRIV